LLRESAHQTPAEPSNKIINQLKEMAICAKYAQVENI
jgi:hypothetical protein